MTATIKDVAARAGVSPKTVSRVMNNEAYVRPQVREAVLHAVAALNYRPNTFARSLSSARSYLLALLIEDPASGYAVAMQRGALERCRAHGFHLLIEPFELHTPGWEARFDTSVAGLRLDGAIVAPPLSQSDALAARLDALGVPHVRISPGFVPATGGLVLFDEGLAAFDMTNHLLALGHRAIGFVGGDPTHAGARLRQDGFTRALAAAGLPASAERVHPGDFTFRAGLVAGEALLDGAAPPSAIFAANDDMALGVCVAAMKRQLPVPGRLSVAGFDDAFTARLAWPPITTVRQPVAAMGAAAVDMLVDPASREAMRLGVVERRLGYELVPRESTAAP